MGHLNCGHLTELDKAVAFGTRDAPTIWNRLLEVLRARGEEHEEAYRKHLAGLGLRMTTIGGKGVDDRSLSETRTAVKEGFDVIAQAALSHDRWVGRADFLLKADRASNLGAHSYEVIDTKLARHTKGGTILQLCLYTELLGHLQGIVPERMYVVSPSAEFEDEPYRFNDFSAFYRLVRDRLLTEIASSLGTAAWTRRGLIGLVKHSVSNPRIY